MNTIKVLIADDHTLFRQGLTRLLSGQSDIRLVAEAKDGAEAIELAKKTRPDVAVVDITMPGIGGDQVAKRIKIDCPNTAVLILTVHNEEDYVEKCSSAGVDGYLLKDVDRKELLYAIRLISRGKHVWDNLSVGVLKDSLHINANGREQRALFNRLRDRELEILRLLVRGMTNKEICTTLGISEHTVRTHLRNIYSRLDISSRNEATALALREGLVSLDQLEPFHREE
jgi:DNA-binding NarL/FixJ family response regulator